MHSRSGCSPPARASAAAVLCRAALESQAFCLHSHRPYFMPALLARSLARSMRCKPLCFIDRSIAHSRTRPLLPWARTRLSSLARSPLLSELTIRLLSARQQQHRHHSPATMMRSTTALRIAAARALTGNGKQVRSTAARCSTPPLFCWWPPAADRLPKLTCCSPVRVCCIALAFLPWGLLLLMCLQAAANCNPRCIPRSPFCRSQQLPSARLFPCPLCLRRRPPSLPALLPSLRCFLHDRVPPRSRLYFRGHLSRGARGIGWECLRGPSDRPT